MKVFKYLCLSFISTSLLAGCTTVASKDDVYLLKSSTNEELAQIKTELKRLQEQVQEISQSVDFVQKDNNNQILNLTTELYDRVSNIENSLAQDKAAVSKKMDVLLDEVSRVEQQKRQQVVVQSTTPIPESAITYTIRTGDTLSKIAVKHGITKEELILANGIQDENYLAIGDLLVIPQE